MDGGMSQARSLRDLFASMSHGSADPAAALADAGHGDLPAHLVTEAVINYADAAPVEVAEHLSPFVVANSAVPAPGGHPYPPVEVHDAFSLLATAPDPMPYDHTDHAADGHSATEHPFDVHHDLDHHSSLLDDVPHPGSHATGQAAGHDTHQASTEHTDLQFGHGQTAALAPHLGGALAADAPGDHDLPGSAHLDPWLVDEPSVTSHDPASALPLWEEHPSTHQDTHSDVHDGTHDAGQLPIDDAPGHDGVDPGHP